MTMYPDEEKIIKAGYSVPISITLPVELVNKIDTASGDIPRSVFIRRILEKAFENED